MFYLQALYSSGNKAKVFIMVRPEYCPIPARIPVRLKKLGTIYISDLASADTVNILTNWITSQSIADTKQNLHYFVRQVAINFVVISTEKPQ